MALVEKEEVYIVRDNNFYRNHYHHFIIGIMLLMVLMLAAAGAVLYLISNRPLPVFTAIQPNQEQMLLTPYDEPNLLPETILRFASKAATAAYTFSFGDYVVANNEQAQAARPYFTEYGWQDYLQSIQGLIDRVVQNRLLVYSIVSGTPVISNEGPLPGRGYVWRVQMPFLVTYKGENSDATSNFLVTISIVRVPTHVNPAGIGVDQFIMA